MTVLLAVFGCSRSDPIETVSDSQRTSSSEEKGDSATGKPMTSPEPTRTEPTRTEPPVETADKNQAVDAAIGSGRLSDAAAMLKRMLVRDPGDASILFRLAQVLKDLGDVRGAIDLLGEIPSDDPQAGVAAFGQAADWCMEIEDWGGAAKRYRQILSWYPDANVARRPLAYIYNRQGRRYEAARLIRSLCQAGDVREDELQSLISVPDAIYHRAETVASLAAGDRPYLPIGNTGRARQAYTEDDLATTARLLRAELDRGDAPNWVWAFYGRVVTEMQDEAATNWWLENVTSDVRPHPEYWVAIGTLQVNDGKFREAIGAFLRAVAEEPSDNRTIRRLRQCFLSINENDSAEFWGLRFQANTLLRRDTQKIAGASPPDAELFREISGRLERLHRRIESVMWRSIAMLYDDQAGESLADLNAIRLQLIQQQMSFPTPAELAGEIDIDQFPASDEKLASLRIEVPEDSGRTFEATDANFVDVAAAWGCDHTFQPGAKDIRSGFAIYQQIGGGVAVADFDRDGNPDLYFAQGASDPPEFETRASNVMVRNLDSLLSDITELCGATETSFSTGVTAGDWNQDGFDDLYVANLGPDLLLINNGDGTFRKSDWRLASDSIHGIDSSAAIADVTGDGLPDLITVRYVDDPSDFERPVPNEQGEVEKTFGPLLYRAVSDRVYVNTPGGRGRPSLFSSDDEARATGLGIVVADLVGGPGNDVFVGNDVQRNQLWTRSKEPDSVAGSPVWEEVAMLRGCAFNRDGSPTASMGIAAADYDFNQQLDLHIANFAKESVSLYLGQNGGFRDRSLAYGLTDPSRPHVGFGSQPIDYNNDGAVDIVVTNGHVDAVAGDTAPLNQPFQLFANVGETFEPIVAGKSGSYATTPHIGRAMATVDLDRDGRQDLVITHMGQPSAVLVNQSSETGHYLDLELVGVDCERLPIGAVATIEAGGRKSRQWLVGGNGYLCRNEPVVHFGLGAQSQVDLLTIQWPDGTESQFHDLPIDRRIVIVQGDESWFVQ
ncbi:ASPIC and UnbV [Rubripirellula tenax]|uniref:ASPIC and UnbV n=2 Tax=Rubripirellula tenax TaxID=2528015 RepID=A0A5C6FIT3_9BACT|nr:ASPIC and UnbV [Rubripirellula tenax]